MHIFETIKETQEFVIEARKKGQTIGFVPTMGALHEGHLELMRHAKRENDLLAVSIFVNPIQFNNPEDLKKYPRVLDHDLKLLQSVKCDFVFTPSEQEMYPEPPTDTFNFGPLEHVMEGAFRPGHFNGVAIVVKKLFQIVEPHRGYFGEKDYQQLAIIKTLVEQEHFPIAIVPCAIVREEDGLAMSSRNTRLTPKERKLAPEIYRILTTVAGQSKNMDPKALQLFGRQQFDQVKAFETEYFELADDRQLQPIEGWKEKQGVRAFVALTLGNVRLIDNIRII
jgi:pantoate--beta-alanine ligase